MKTSLHLQSGASMIEIMITLLIVSFGLLSLSGLMLTGLRSNASSHHRAIATQQAYDLADRMRANMVAVNNRCYSTASTTAGCNAPTSDPGCISSGCTPEQMAQYDIFTWNQNIAALLPLGAGTIVQDATTTTTSTVFNITVSWDDTRSGAANRSFVVRFEP
jgi:type IV pilus assembly protein PilV